MSRFDRYVFRIIIKYAIIIQAIVTLVAIMASGVSDLRKYAVEDITIGQLLVVQLLTMPVKINSTLIIAVVTASIVTVVQLMRSKEMLAYISVGGRVGRVLYPFIFVAVLAAAELIWFEHSLYPHIKAARSRYLIEVVEGGRFQGPSQNLVNMWMIDNNERLVHANVIDPINKRVSGLTEYFITEDFQVESIRLTTEAAYDGTQWVLTDVHDTNLLEIPPRTNVREALVIQSRLLDDLTSMSGQSRKQLERAQIYSMIQVLKAHGLSATSYEMLFYSVYATSLSGIILVILVVPMGIDFSRRYSPLKSSISSFALALSFWGSYSACESFGFAGILPPIMACFLPLIVFFFIGGFILIQKERAR